ncbi:MAG: hypothetical protein K0R62_359 [Nonomuraea muscovyensis]|nr:hypothetical protein [Nonomuraea muscovyensis]
MTTPPPTPPKPHNGPMPPSMPPSTAPSLSPIAASEATVSFEDLLHTLVVAQTNGRDCERAKLYRPWSDTIRIQQGDDQAGTYVIQNKGGTVYLQPERRSPRRAEQAPEPVIQDAPGYDLKPDPLGARSVPELEELARDFWRWADKPSSRQIAERSKGAFSHATVAKIVYDRPGKPALTMRYLLGLIRGCGGDKEEQQRWATAWRLLDRGVVAMKPSTTSGFASWGPTRAG